jgi:hypothetical protein
MSIVLNRNARFLCFFRKIFKTNIPEKWIVKILFNRRQKAGKSKPLSVGVGKKSYFC